MEPIGATLRRAREARGLTLQQAKQALRVHSDYLDALEAEEFDKLPAPVYVRAFLREYARFLGLDPEPLLQAYAARQPESKRVLPGPAWAPPFEAPSRGGRTAVMLAVLGLLVAFALGAYGPLLDQWKAWQATQRLSPSRSKAGADQPSPPGDARGSPVRNASMAESKDDRGVPSESAGRPPLASAVAPDELGSVQAKEPGVQVAIVARDHCWVRIRSDGTLLYQGILRPGETHTWHAPNALDVRVGNAGAISITVNGRDLGVPGYPGQVWQQVFRADAPPPRNPFSDRLPQVGP